MAGTELRYELKFTAPEYNVNHARTWIRLHPEGFRRTYESRIVNSIYFDTPDLQHLNANLSGNNQRHKVRLRWYGKLTSSIPEPILELKNRDSYLGDKKRLSLENSLDMTQPWQQIMRQIRKEAYTKDPSWQQQLHAILTPTIINRYKREYFASPDGKLRLTFDYNQQVFNQRFSAKPNIHFPQHIEPLLVIEMKAPPEFSGRLETATSHLPIRRSRNSKYVNAVLSAPR